MIATLLAGDLVKSSDVPAELAAIAHDYGDRLAELIADYLEVATTAENVRSPAPLPYLLELGAVLQLTAWEASGLRDSLPPGLISAEAAREQLTKRIRSGASSFNQPGSAVLFQQVFYCWLQNCAWTAPSCLSAELVISETCEAPEQWLDQLARFLWDNRSMLSELDQEMNNA